MEIQLTDTLRPVPVLRPARRSATQKITLVCKGEKAWISAGKNVRLMMDLDPAKSHPVVVLASRAQLAIHPVQDGPNARPISTGGRINVPELVSLLHLKDGERFEIPVAVENGMIVGPMPEAIFTRVGFMARKNRVSGRAA